MTQDELRYAAALRAERHANHTSSRLMLVDYELVGLVGEVEFCRRFGFELKGDLMAWATEVMTPRSGWGASPLT